jgi:nicotinamide-nucleotide amidase
MVGREKLSDNSAKELGAVFKAQGFMLVLAESCTGGMVAQTVTSIAGSSAWFDRGFVTYSNAAKVEMLGVKPLTLEKFGAVSEEVAKEMVLGCLKNSHANIAASITGIAGPDGGSLEKPVGTVCFAWADINNTVTTSTKHFYGNREEIRQKAAIFCLTELIQKLELFK